jgi:transposase-like protein
MSRRAGAHPLEGPARMLNDTDTWPITCIECGHKTLVEIGRLKTKGEFTCHRCGRTFEFLTKVFLSSLEQLQATVRFIRGNTRLLADLDVEARSHRS